MNQLDSAWTYEYRAYQNVLRLNLINNLPYVLRILGNIQTKWGDLRLAMTYYQKSKQVAVKENNLRNVAFANMAIARYTPGRTNWIRVFTMPKSAWRKASKDRINGVF